MKASFQVRRCTFAVISFINVVSEFAANTTFSTAEQLISTDPNKATWIGSNIAPFASLIQQKKPKGSRKPPNKWNKVEPHYLSLFVLLYLFPLPLVFWPIIGGKPAAYWIGRNVRRQEVEEDFAVHRRGQDRSAMWYAFPPPLLFLDPISFVQSLYISY